MTTTVAKRLDIARLDLVATQRTELFTARMTPDELMMLQELAAADGISASDFVRQFVRQRFVEKHGALKGPKPARGPRKSVSKGAR